MAPSDVEALRAERKALRRSFTVALKRFNDALGEEDSVELGRNFYQLEDKHKRLQLIDNSLKEVQGANDADFTATEEYYDKMSAAKYDFEHFKKTSRPKSDKQVYRLPKLQLESFNLSPKTWLPFWAQYKRIYENETLDFSDKFQYLLMSLKDGPGKDMIASYPRDADSLDRAVEALKARYGRETMLIEIYTREIVNIVIKREFVSVSNLFDQLSSHLRALGGLGVTAEKCAFILYPLVESCLPPELLKVWERHRRGRDEKGSMVSLTEDLDANPLDQLMAFLEEEVRSEERIQRASQMTKMAEEPSRQTAAALVSTSNHPQQAAAALVNTFNVKVSSCLFCEKDHPSHDCFKAQAMAAKERDDIVVKKGACFKCLLRGHRVTFCKIKVKCLLCAKGHYTLMCKRREELRERKTHEEGKGPEKGKDTKKTQANFSGALSRTYLKTLMVRISNKRVTLTVRALLDDGAHRSYLAEDVINQLKLTPVGKEFISHGLFGGVDGTSKEHNIYNLKVAGVYSDEFYDVTVVEQGTICHNLTRPSPLRDPGLFAALQERGVCLSDIGENPPPVQLLLGADTLGSILTGTINVLPNGISAVETKLGWSILGSSSKRAKSVVSLCLNAFCRLQDMWELEAIGITEPMVQPISNDKEEVNDVQVHFEHTLKKEDGRYVVALPWMPGRPPLNDNLRLARMRLESTTAKLKREGYFDEYNDVFKKWQLEGIIEPVSDWEDSSNICHYLPHRPVIRLEKTTSRIRPVFDASAKMPGSASLNECLFKGANLLQQIPPLLLKFRLGKYGLTADIKQAFLQLIVAKGDRNVLRFLWWDSDGNVVVYRHCRVVFGITSSPYLLNATILYHLNKYESDEELESRRKLIMKLKASFYVDDSISSFDTQEDLNSFMDIAKDVMALGKFELTKWTSNAPWLKLENNDASVLGLKWNLNDDLIYCVNVQHRLPDGCITKRMLLGIVNAVYDPIGVLSPAMLTPRILLQEAWKIKIGWDDPLPSEIQRNFNSWAQYLPIIDQIRIPRHVFSGDLAGGPVSVHMFSDASQKGYGCCIFLRHEIDNIVSVQLIAAKSRVAPLQAQTIPRMELLGACVAVRLYQSLKGVFTEVIPTYFWTDSMTVLAWITKGLTWGTFVGNRVKEIRNGSDINAWRHVPGPLNPSDICSRGSTLKTLLELQWWEGPSWLKEAQGKWPKAEIECTEQALCELRDKKSEVVLTTLDDNNFSSVLTRYSSSYLKILRMVAWILRFLYRKRTAGPLVADELWVAEMKILALVQRESDCSVQGIQTHRDQEGLLRVTSRVVESDRETSLIILPSKHILVSCIIMYTHKVLQHAGVGTTLARIRERFWLIKGRNAVKKVLANCFLCKKLMGKTCVPEPAFLPTERTSIKAFPFQTTGIDLFGPLYLSDNSKVWGILFTCAVYRGVRLDLVESISTECFIRALRRFLSRNNCEELYSDNGTNFTGFSNLLRALDWNAVHDFLSSKRLRMKHSPPASPWYGGFFERLVGVVKQCLKKQVGGASLTRDELATVFCECENVVNGRPLTYVSDDPKDFRAITPAHFMQESPGIGAPEIDCMDSRSLVKRVQYVQKVREELRNRFSHEYLSLLVQRSEGKRLNIKAGDIVLIEAENKKRQMWPLGRVIECYPGRDGKPRVARVKTQWGELVRPFQRLYPLELHSAEEPVEVNSSPKHEVSETVLDEGECYSGGPKTETPLELKCTKTRGGRVVKPPAKLDL